jgi:hypothetical protein
MVMQRSPYASPPLLLAYGIYTAIVLVVVGEFGVPLFGRYLIAVVTLPFVAFLLLRWHDWRVRSGKAPCSLPGCWHQAEQ